MDLTELFTQIADAIRSKKGTTDPIRAIDFPTEIESIEGTKSYTELPYIQSTGTQYINTGIIPTNHSIEIKAQYTSSTDNTVLFGVGSADYHLTWYGGKWYFGDGNTEKNGGSAYPCTNLNTFIYNKNKTFSINGNNINTSLNAYASSQLYLLYRPKKVNVSASAKIYYCKIYDNETGKLVRDFIPAKDLNGVVGLYDKVSTIFFYNNGSGNFIA